MTKTTTDKTIDRPEWLPEAEWPFEIRSADVGPGPVAYTDEGRGPVLLLVHDGLWSFVWSRMIEALSGEYRVLTLDFPGSGLSPETVDHVGLASDSLLLERFVSSLELEKVTLIAHDLGGPVGLGWATRNSGLIDGLALINTFAWPADLRSLRAMLRLMSSRPVRWVDATTNLIPRLTSGRFGIGRNLGPEPRRAFLGGFRDRGPRRRFHDLMGAARHEVDYLAQVESRLQPTLGDRPVLTIFGARNDPFGFQPRFRRYFDDIEEMVVPKGYHFPMADDPDGVATRIATWHTERIGR